MIEKTLLEPFPGKEALFERAFSVRHERLSERYLVLLSLAQAYGRLQGDDAHVSAWRERLQQNWTRLLGCSGASLEEMAADLKVERDLEYYKGQRESLLALTRQPEISEFQLFAGLYVVGELEEALEKKRAGRDAKRLRPLLRDLQTTVVPQLKASYVYGCAPNFTWDFDVWSDFEAELRMQARVKRCPESERGQYSFFFDKSNGRYPTWYIFVDSTRSDDYTMALVSDKPLWANARSGQVQLNMPRVACDSMESQFKGSREHEKGYLRELVRLLRGSEFLDRTGYERVMLTGIRHEVSSEEQAHLGLQRLDDIRTNRGEFVPAYALCLTGESKVLQLPRLFSLPKNS